MTAKGKIVAVNGNMISVAFDGAVAQNEVGYAQLGNMRLMAEIVRVRGTRCDRQVFESTTGLSVDDDVEFTGELLAAELGPGLLGQVYDGLQNPLPELAEEAGKISKDAGFFLQRGMYLPGLPREDPSLYRITFIDQSFFLLKGARRSPKGPLVEKRGKWGGVVKFPPGGRPSGNSPLGVL